MSRRLTLSGDALSQMMTVVHRLGGGQDLDDILLIIAQTVTEVIGFDAVAVNVRGDDGNLVVRAVTGPPEVEELRGGSMSESRWRELLTSCENWGGLFFSRSPDMGSDVPNVDPWSERLPGAAESPTLPTAAGFLPTEPWQAPFALLAPVWSEGRVGGRLQGVISVDLPRGGRTPDAEQQMLLELFAGQVGIAIDRVTEVEDASDRIALYRAAFVDSPLATALLDARLIITDVNDAFLQLADAIPGELEHRSLVDLLIVDAAAATARLSLLGPGQTENATIECGLRHPRGVDWERWVDVTVRRVDSIHDDPRYVCTLTDRTDARNEMNRIRHLADHDALTGLSARSVWLEALRSRLASHATAYPDSGSVGVLFCDLDGFKRVNDRSGHLAGDGILVTVADRLRAVSSPADVVCRWGGDEFAVVATRESVDEISDLAVAMIASVDSLAASAAATDPVAQLSISIGIAVVTGAGRVESVARLVEIADNALYRAKRNPDERLQITVT